MAQGLVIHIEVGSERHTEVLAQERIRIGAGPDCDLRFQPDIIPHAPALLLELARTNGHYHITDFDPALGLTYNGAPLKEGHKIEDGDQVQLAASDFKLQFFPLSVPPALVPEHAPDVHVAPFIQDAAIEAAATARRDDAKVFLREFTRELLREINLSTKIIALVLVATLVGGVLYLGNALYDEMRRGRELIDKQNEQLRQQQTELGQINER